MLLSLVSIYEVLIHFFVVQHMDGNVRNFRQLFTMIFQTLPRPLVSHHPSQDLWTLKVTLKKRQMSNFCLKNLFTVEFVALGYFCHIPAQCVLVSWTNTLVEHIIKSPHTNFQEKILSKLVVVYSCWQDTAYGRTFFVANSESLHVTKRISGAKMNILSETKKKLI